MRGRLIALACSTVFPLALAVPAPLTALAAPAAAKCAAAGYSKALVKCHVVPSHGKFSIPIPHSKYKLIGTGSKPTSGTQITVIRVPAPVRSRRGFGIRVRAKGKFKALHLSKVKFKGHLSKGKLYRYVPAKNALVGVKSVTHSGVYQVV